MLRGAFLICLSLMVISYLLGLKVQQQRIRQLKLDKWGNKLIPTLASNYNKMQGKEYYVYVMYDIKDLTGLNHICNGDLLIQQMILVLRDQLRKQEYYGRIGGGIFGVVMEKEGYAQRVVEIQKSIMDNIRDIMGLEVEIKVGVVSQLEGKKFCEIETQVYTARKVALQLQTEEVVIYEEVQQGEITKRLLHQEVREAMREGDMLVYYQGKFAKEGKQTRLVGAEALVRWNEHGVIRPPGYFLPTLEEQGGMQELDQFVLMQVLKDKKAGLTVPVSVNITMETLRKGGEKWIVDQVKEAGVTGVEIELLESAFYTKEIGDKIAYLRENGLRVLMDDFGSGYSSLASLSDIVIDEIKVDRGFVKELGTKKGGQVLECIVNLAAGLNVDLILEGVETEQDQERAQEKGVVKVQGYYHMRPCSFEEFKKKQNKEVKEIVIEALKKV